MLNKEIRIREETLGNECFGGNFTKPHVTISMVGRVHNGAKCFSDISICQPSLLDWLEIIILQLVIDLGLICDLG